MQIKIMEPKLSKPDKSKMEEKTSKHSSRDRDKNPEISKSSRSKHSKEKEKLKLKLKKMEKIKKLKMDSKSSLHNSKSSKDSSSSKSSTSSSKLIPSSSSIPGTVPSDSASSELKSPSSDRIISKNKLDISVPILQDTSDLKFDFKMRDNNKDMSFKAEKIPLQLDNFTQFFDGNLNLPKLQDDITDMDVDPSGQLIIVPDTNIWISYLPVLKALMNKKFTIFGLPYIVIPWIVLEELDYRQKSKSLLEEKKSDKKLEDSAYNSRCAIKFIYYLLSSKNSQIRTQLASEAALSEKKFTKLNEDDSILQCVQQCYKHECDAIVLLSNDNNLLCKALANGIKAYKAEDVIERIIREIVNNNVGQDSNDLNNFNESSKIFSLCQQQFDDKNSNSRKILDAKRYSSSTNSTNKTNRNSRRESSRESVPASESSSSARKPVKRSHSSLETDMEVEDLAVVGYQHPKKASFISENRHGPISPILNQITETLSFLIESKMKEDLGEFWIDSLKVKPPWTLFTAIDCLIKHWIGFFSFVFGPKAIQHVESLKIKCKKSAASKEFIEDIIGLFNLTNKYHAKKDYYPKIMACRQELIDFIGQ